MPVIVNREGGTARKRGDRLEADLVSAFKDVGQPIDLHCTDAAAIRDTVAASDAPVIAVGGGDGTIAAAASALAGTGRKLAVLPLGTLNHFARTLGLDGTLSQAAAVAAGPASEAIDIRRLGEHLFLNNVSLGLYARMVDNRDRRRLPKWLATIPAALHVLGNPGARRFAIDVDGRRIAVTSPLIFIGNNRYQTGAGRLGERASLRDGLLSIFAVSEQSPAGLLMAALRILFGRFDPLKDFAAIAEGKEVVIHGGGDHRVALDGEIAELDFPLRLTSAPGALEVIVP